MKSSWQHHDGKTYFYARYDFGTMEELRAECAAIEAELTSQPAGSILLLVNPRNALVSPESISLYKAHVESAKVALRRIALLRMEGWKAFVADMVLPLARLDDVKIFEDEDSAKKWLAS